jgi:hypothetical protein
MEVSSLKFYTEGLVWSHLGGRTITPEKMKVTKVEALFLYITIHLVFLTNISL